MPDVTATTPSLPPGLRKSWAIAIEAGFVTARIRSINVLYLSKGLVQKEDFGPAERIEIEKLWEWPGKPWGGLPDGTSIVDPMEIDSADSNPVE